jgi:hypothetical protein
MNWLFAWWLSDDRYINRLPSWLRVAILLWAVIGITVSLFRLTALWLGPAAACWIIGAAAVSLGFGLWFALRQSGIPDRTSAEPCVKCGYDLGANMTTRCPECGTACVAHSAEYVHRHRGGNVSERTTGKLP